MEHLGTMVAGLAAILLAAGIAALVRGRFALRETTLLPAWWWTVAALFACGGTEIATALVPADDGWLAPLRFTAAGLTLCPIVAVLGAKRPQHHAWNFVVLAFWGIMVLPVAETFLLQRGQRLEIGDARGWFLWPLILLGPINYLPTRRWLAALFVLAGQILLFSEYLPLVSRPLFAGQQLAALLLVVLALWLPKTASRPAANPYDRLWRDFRDEFGLFWALRLQERANFVSQANGWPFELAWSGLVDSATRVSMTQVDPAITPTLRTTLQGLLRRFVSARWIAERLRER
ncbi:MAG: hypothetical protein SFU86_09710 [Pirellulaceae bacterium]|nr:hypothetical protein [Pirellulaceae bacterium]